LRPKLAVTGKRSQSAFYAVKGIEYVIEYKDRLDGAPWQELETRTRTGSLQTITDPDATRPSRFYRIRIR